MALSPQLTSIFEECAVPSAFGDWLKSNGISSVNDFVWAACNDKAFVDPEMIDVCGVSLGLSGKVAVRKAW